jgi:hypothetical protein
MEWLDNDIVVAVIAFLSSATGTGLIVFFARKVIGGAKKLFDDKNGELGILRETSKKMIAENERLTEQVKTLIADQTKLFEITKTAFLNDPKLVANGTSKRIAQILEKGENK